MTDLRGVPVATTGQARAPGPTLHEQLLADPTPPPWPLLEQSPLFLGDADVPYTNYTSPEYAAAEHEHMWSKTWQWACHADHIPEAGDFYVYDIGHHSALVVRTEDGTVKAYYNACMHRGTQLRSPGTCGFARELKCPFHGWTWSLDGDLIDVPDRWDFPHISDESHHLAEMPVEVFAGFVWVNFDPDAQPLAEYLGVLPAHFAEFGIENRYIETHVRKRMPANWKAAAEAFLEAYHVRETHASGQLGDEVTTQYDVFEPNISRFIHTVALNSPQRPKQFTEPELWARLSNSRAGTPATALPDGVRARDHYAKHVQAEMGNRGRSAAMRRCLPRCCSSTSTTATRSPKGSADSVKSTIRTRPTWLRRLVAFAPAASAVRRWATTRSRAAATCSSVCASTSWPGCSGCCRLG